MKKTTEQFIKDSINIHGKKYDYSIINYTDSRIKVPIICKIHGIFYQTPNKHLSKRGCPKCADSRLTIEEFIKKSNIIHKNKYDYSKSIYKNYKSVINIICPIHGIFYQTSGNHLSGKGCLKCKSDITSKIKRKSIQQFINDSILIHGDRYDYSISLYTRNSNRIPIKCKIHGIFHQRIQHHLDGHGCPKCHHRISKPENEFLDYLKIDESSRQLMINRKLIDGLHNKIIYEFLGDFWHGNPEKFKDNQIHPYIKKTYKQIREKTFNKLKYLKNLGYKVKYIWESDWNNFKKGLSNKPNIQTI